MNKNKIRVCIFIDKKTNERFKKRYPCMLSRYIEKCMLDGLNDKNKVFESVENKNIMENIFNRGIK